jgi:hypothetical protein
MRTLVLTAALVAASFSFIACKKKVAPADGAAPSGPASQPNAAKPTPPAPPAPPAPKPGGDILGQGAVGGVDEIVAALEPYLSAFQDSALTTAAVKAQVGKWIGLESWDGIDGQKAARVWFVNPKKFKPPFVVALPLLAGKKAAVKAWASEEIAGHVVLAKDAGTIAALKATIEAQLKSPAGVAGGRLSFGLDVPTLLEVYAPEIEKLLRKIGRKLGGPETPVGGDTKKFLQWLARGALDLARQITRVEAELTAARDHARLAIKLLPLAGTALADFTSAPKQPFPANISRAPGDVSVAAVLSYAPDALKRVFERIAASMEAAGADKPGAFLDFVRGGFVQLLGALRGDLVYTKRMSGATTALLGAADGAKGLAALREFYSKASVLMQADVGPKSVQTKVEIKKEAGAHKGVKYDRMRVQFDYSKLNDFERKLLESIQGKGMDSFLATKGDVVLLAGSNKTVETPIQEALDTLASPPAGKTLADKPEFKALLAALPPNRFGVLYVSFVDYVKGVFAALASAGGPGLGAGKALDALKSEGYLGGSLSIEGTALQIDAVATRSHIESIKNFFKAMRPK